MEPADSLLVGFKSHLRAETVPAEAVYLLSGKGVTALAGASIERLAPLLDGTRSLAQVKQDALPYLAGDEVGLLLTRLFEAKLIDYREPAAGERDPAADAYWSLAGLDSATAASATGSLPVEVVAVGHAGQCAAERALTASGAVLSRPMQDTPALTFVLCDDYLDPGLAAVNRDHLASGRPWLLAKLSGAEPWVGPVFRPGAGPCWACLAKRLEGTRQGEFPMQPGQDSPAGSGLPEASLWATRELGLSAAVLEALKWLAGLRYPGQHAISVLDTLTLQRRHHPVAQRPQCTACGDPGLVAARVQRPIAFTGHPITARDGNGQRALTPGQMLDRYSHLVDPVTGVVAELRRDPRTSQFQHAYLSGRNRAMLINGVAEVKGLRAFSGGKGATELEAKVGALCEAVERYCGTLAGDEPVIRESFRGLGDAAVHPAASMLFDERQYAGRARWNAACAPFHRVPEPFDESAPADWTPMWSLRTGRQRLVPTALLYFNPGSLPQHASLRADSNGNAAGSTLEDAITHGFFELAERDAVALWWYNRTRHPAIDLESFGDPWITGQPGVYRRLHREVWALDVTSDLGIPAVAAISRRTDKPAEDIMFGFGAHADPAIAARRALTELGQLLPAAVGARADGTGYALADPHLRQWWQRATVASQPYLLPDPGQRPRTAADFGYTPRATLDLGCIRSAVARAGLDLLVLDQTRPDINMPVVKVMVPGLRHFWPRFAPGRLFEAPVAQGLLSRPTPYTDLNPIPLYV